MAVAAAVSSPRDKRQRPARRDWSCGKSSFDVGHAGWEWEGAGQGRHATSGDGGGAGESGQGATRWPGLPVWVRKVGPGSMGRWCVWRARLAHRPRANGMRETRWRGNPESACWKSSSDRAAGISDWSRTVSNDVGRRESMHETA